MFTAQNHMQNENVYEASNASKPKIPLEDFKTIKINKIIASLERFIKHRLLGLF